MKTVSVKDLIKLAGNTIFSVDFIKKDGTLRKMQARLGVQKGVKGVGLAYNPDHYGLLCVYDVQKQGFRMINLNTIQRVALKGLEFRVSE